MKNKESSKIEEKLSKKRIHRIKKNIYFQLFIEFFTLGLFTFGGGMAMIGVLRDRVCDKRGWLTEEETLDCIAISQGLPGVIALNMSVYVGYVKKGTKGALVSIFAMVLPSLTIIIVIAKILTDFGGDNYVNGLLMGIRAGVSGIMIYTVLKLSLKMFKGVNRAIFYFNIVVASLAFIGVLIFKIDAAWIVLGAIITGILYNQICTMIKNKGEEK